MLGKSLNIHLCQIIKAIEIIFQTTLCALYCVFLEMCIRQ